MDWRELLDLIQTREYRQKHQSRKNSCVLTRMAVAVADLQGPSSGVFNDVEAPQIVVVSDVIHASRSIHPILNKTAVFNSDHRTRAEALQGLLVGGPSSALNGGGGGRGTCFVLSQIFVCQCHRTHSHQGGAVGGGQGAERSLFVL